MTLAELLGLASVPFLILANGFFVAAEFALVSVRRTELEELAKEGKPGAANAKRAVEQLDRMIAATQLGITIASLALGWLGEQAFERLLEPILEHVVGGWVVHSISAILALAIITFFHVVLGELVAKSIAIQRPRAVSLVVARPLLLFAGLFTPAIIFLNLVGNFVLRRFGLKPVTSHSRAHSVEELRMLVEETQQAGIIKEESAGLLKNVFRLRGKTAKDAMIPIEKVGMLDLRWGPEQILDAVRSGAHTRMPVYERERGNCVGVVNTKDLFHLHSLKGIVNIFDIMRPPSFVAPEARLEDLLREFRKHRRHLGLIRDAGGTLVGIVTLEDILEEIVGEIEDEHDRPTAAVTQATPTSGPNPAVGPTATGTGRFNVTK